DYKYRQGREMKSQDRDLFVSAIRGFRLQPPLYALMAIPNGEQAGSGAASESAQPEQVEFVFLAPNWGQVVDRTQFKASAWRDAAGRQLAQTVHTLVEGVEAGRYFILPDGYCDYCEFAAACRRFHGPTWWRAHSSGPAKQLRQLRKQKVSQK
ncbi:MAG: PD-(D/E)XK nuclease family protein, partial [Terriglobales bacterium]